jgi:hypothetical protein
LRAHYAYDANGNRIGQSGPGVEPVDSTQVQLDAQDRLLEFGTTAGQAGRREKVHGDLFEMAPLAFKSRLALGCAQ